MDRYDIKAKIGEGGSGAVYRAWDKIEQKAVAIKRLAVPEDPSGNSDPEIARAALMREASFLSSLDHPGICKVLDFGIDEQGGFAVLELANGETLEQAGSRKMTVEEFGDIAEQLLSALHHAHLKGLVHGDLKPSNAMLNWKPGRVAEVKLIDFGLARFSPRSSHQEIINGSTKGSVFYMAPEQLEQGPIDARADIYALACTFYYILTSRVPFDGSSVGEIQHNHFQHRLAGSLTELRPDVPQPLRQWIHWLMNRQPQDRPQSALEALESLRELGVLRPKLVTASVQLPKASVAAAVPSATPTTRSAPLRSGSFSESDSAASPRSRIPWLVAGAGIVLALIAFAVSRPSGDPVAKSESATSDESSASNKPEVPKDPPEATTPSASAAGSKEKPTGKAALADRKWQEGEKVSLFTEGESQATVGEAATMAPPTSPPPGGLVVWLKADTGTLNAEGVATKPGHSVQKWEDQAPLGGRNDAEIKQAEPPNLELTTIEGLNSPQHLIRFRASKKTGALVIAPGDAETIDALFGDKAGTCILFFQAKASKAKQRLIHCLLRNDKGSTITLAADETGIDGGVRWKPGRAEKFQIIYQNPNQEAKIASLWWQTKTESLSGVVGGRLLKKGGQLLAPAPLSYDLEPKMKDLAIGASSINTDALEGYIGEVLIYNKMLSNADLTQVEAYLHAKFLR